MKDDITQVKDTTAWTLGRISDVLPDTLKNEGTLHSLVTVVTEGLSDTPRVASNCCWVITINIILYIYIYFFLNKI